MEEELVRDINEWCFETFEWLQNRNATIVGPRQVMNKTTKTDFGLRALFAQESQDETTDKIIGRYQQVRIEILVRSKN